MQPLGILTRLANSTLIFKNSSCRPSFWTSDPMVSRWPLIQISPDIDTVGPQRENGQALDNFQFEQVFLTSAGPTIFPLFSPFLTPSTITAPTPFLIFARWGVESFHSPPLSILDYSQELFYWFSQREFHPYPFMPLSICSHLCNRFQCQKIVDKFFI